MGNEAVPSLQTALELDAQDDLHHLRSEFHFPGSIAGAERKEYSNSPTETEERIIYLCGNSLGLQPRETKSLVLEELQVWANRGVHGHHNHPKSRPWVDIDENVTNEMAKIVGALRSEVAVMGTLTSNLHFLMASFYRPSSSRYKIIIEDKAFPSDYYAVESQIIWHGLEPSDAIISIAPKPGRYTLDIQDILKTIDEQQGATAMILLSGVQYYTGQLFEMERITEFAKQRGITVGWDLAHAVGNVELSLHDWGVDFAVWCSYKYLNAGPGAFVAIPGAAGFQHSNPSVLSTVCLLASLRVFAKTSMKALRTKSTKLTSYAEKLLMADEETVKHFEIITPSNPSERGAQLSLLFKNGIMEAVYKKLERAGIVADKRQPDVIRIAPAPLYNTYEEVYRFSAKLQEAILDVTRKMET
ncbi:Kynureninase [Dactylellina cionopaga]|nr:Kynureninase [Dactylellina cionopaga]